MQIDGIQNIETFSLLIDNFTKNPGGVSAGFGQLGRVRASHFSFNPRSPLPLSILDTGLVPTTVNSLWQPLKLISEGYWDIQTMLLIEGYLAGLNLNKIKILQQACHEGYFAEYAGPLHSHPADQFYHLYSCLRAMEVISQQAVEGSSPHQAESLLTHLTHEINTILRSQSKTPPSTARPTQRQMFATAASYPDKPILSRAARPSNPSTAMQVNQVADRHLYFPDKLELSQSNLRDIHKIWKRNLQTLIGILGEESIPLFGLHGTDQAGMEAITSLWGSRLGIGEYICADGYNYPVNPIALLADLSNMANEAASYVGNEGGIFVLDTTNALPCGGSFVTEVPKLPLDTHFHERFFSLMKRNGEGPLITRMADGGTAVEEGALVNVDKFHLLVSPFSYSNVVGGLIRVKDTFYLGKSTHKRSAEILFAERFKTQEVVISALDRLNALGDLSRAPWEVYHKAGEQLIALPKGSMAVPFSEAIHVERNFAQLESPAGRFLSSYTRPSSPIPAVNRREIGSSEFTDLQDVDLHAHVSSNGSDMVLQLTHLSSQKPPNPQHIMDQFSQFAERNGAKRLFVEVGPHLAFHKQSTPKSPHAVLDWIDKAFHQWSEKYPIVLERKRITGPESPNTTAYVFQVSLTTP